MTNDELWDELNPGPSTPARRKRHRPEKKVQKEIVSWLLSRGVLVAVTDAGLMHGGYTGMPMGWPDLTCCLTDGRFLGVECKAKRGSQSNEQKRMQAEIERRGGVYILARSLGEVKKILE